MPPKPSPKPPGPGGKPGKRPPGKGKPGKGKPGKGKPRPGGKSPPPSSPTPDANRHSVLGNFFPTQASLPANRTTVSPYQAVQYGLGTPGQPHPLSVNTPPLLPDQMSALSPLTRGGGPAYGGGSMGAAPHSPPHHNQQISSPVMDRTPWSPVAQPPSTAMHPAMQPPHGSTIQPLSPQPSSPCAVTPLSPRPSSPTCMPLSPPPHMRSCQPLSQPMQHCYQQPPPQQHHQFMQHCGPPPNHCAPQQMQPQPQSPQNGCQPMQHCCPQPSVPHQQPRNATPPAAAQTPPSSPPSPLPPQPATAVQHARPMPSPPQQSGLLALLSQVVAPVSTFETLTVQHGQANKLKSEGEFMRDLRELEYDTAHKELIHRTQEQEAECARMEREIRNKQDELQRLRESTHHALSSLQLLEYEREQERLDEDVSARQLQETMAEIDKQKEKARLAELLELRKKMAMQTERRAELAVDKLRMESDHKMQQNLMTTTTVALHKQMQQLRDKEMGLESEWNDIERRRTAIKLGVNKCSSSSISSGAGGCSYHRSRSDTARQTTRDTCRHGHRDGRWETTTATESEGDAHPMARKRGGYSRSSRRSTASGGRKQEQTRPTPPQSLSPNAALAGLQPEQIAQLLVAAQGTRLPSTLWAPPQALVSPPAASGDQDRAVALLDAAQQAAAQAEAAAQTVALLVQQQQQQFMRCMSPPAVPPSYN